MEHKVIVIVLANEDEELEYTFCGYSIPSCAHKAELWAHDYGYKLIRSQKAQRKMYPVEALREPISKMEKIYYAVKL